MALIIVADFRILMQKAHALGQAEKRGNPAEIQKAQEDHDAYKSICLNADQLATGLTAGAL